MALICRSALALVGTSTVASWGGLVFWFAVSGSQDPDTSSAAVLVHMYRTTEEDGLHIAWPLVVFAALFLSGIITMVSI